MTKRSLAQTGATNSNEHRESRPCRLCGGSGSVLEEAEYDPTTGVLTKVTILCPTCSGGGEVSVYVYPGRDS